MMAEVKNNIVYITDSLPEEVIACQLAEECAELAQAALKLYRCVSGDNPTLVRKDEAIKKIAEEFADVELAFNILSRKIGIRFGDVLKVYDEKTERWAFRLRGVQKNEVEKD